MRLVFCPNLLPNGTLYANIRLMATKDAHKVERKKSNGGVAGGQKATDRRWRLVDEEFSRRTLKQSETITRLSHDIRNQLYIIIGFAELMLEEIPGKINDEQRDNLNDVLKSGKRLLNLLDNGVIPTESRADGNGDG
jgi:signal transduction histidine kinase